MVVERDQDLSYEETEITKILISIICLYGNEGLPIDRVNVEFQNYCGYVIPYKKFGAENLRSWILTLPNIYIILDSQNNEVLIQQSPKSTHIKQLIVKQKSNPKYQMRKKKYEVGYFYGNTKKPKKINSLPQGSFIHTSINNISINESTRFDKFEQLVSYRNFLLIKRYNCFLLQECMLPLLYKHQALGDDFFVDIADTKLGYYVSDKGKLYNEHAKKYYIPIKKIFYKPC